MPSSQSVEVTHNAIFTTMVTGVGPFTYQWRHNGTIISIETRHSLIIRNVVPDDSGVYSCKVMNLYGDSDSTLASLIVTGMYRFNRFLSRHNSLLYNPKHIKIVLLMYTVYCLLSMFMYSYYFVVNPPVIVEHPMNAVFQLFSNFTNHTLTCEADGALSYKWERQNGIIPFDSTGVNTNTLTLINLQPEDAGNYRCVATNASGSSESNYAAITISGIYEYVHVCMHICMHVCVCEYIRIYIFIIHIYTCVCVYIYIYIYIYIYT